MTVSASCSPLTLLMRDHGSWTPANHASAARSMSTRLPMCDSWHGTIVCVMFVPFRYGLSIRDTYSALYGEISIYNRGEWKQHMG